MHKQCKICASIKSNRYCIRIYIVIIMYCLSKIYQNMRFNKKQSLLHTYIYIYIVIIIYCLSKINYLRIILYVTCQKSIINRVPRIITRLRRAITRVRISCATRWQRWDTWANTWAVIVTSRDSRARGTRSHDYKCVRAFALYTCVVRSSRDLSYSPSPAPPPPHFRACVQSLIHKSHSKDSMENQ